MLIPGIYGREILREKVHRIFNPRTAETDPILTKILTGIIVKEGSIEDVKVILEERRDFIKRGVSSLYKAARRFSAENDPAIYLLWARIPETDSEVSVVLVGSSVEDTYKAVPLEDLKISRPTKEKAIQIIVNDGFCLSVDGDILEPTEP